ncbi:PREDICTED: protein SCAI-like [Priapulus caudatus]|uniref:Protein SCAI-like n=1 Tax=Priapulus caudatus TaxID=37621 RepID=A0ABM1DWX1_PRICU|nr:PREDICTED: protein SCAI-like [Priapulus caudatus]
MTEVKVDRDEHERKVVNEFCHLLEKSKQLFNGLRDLPQYGHKQWQSYFGRTFDVYTKLWKFQQQNRQILDLKYGLKRWQIGEMASKIGQLYYHYYLRTSETNYLNEAFSFYSAIKARAYYSKATREDSISGRPDLMVKKLRYYARFIVVCLLLKKMKMVRELVRELSRQIEDYTATYEPDDQLEWSLVLGEIKGFVEADNLAKVLDTDLNALVLTHRLSPLNLPPIEKGMPVPFTLQEILIIGNCAEQIKFSELTLDMYRMLQTFEREPQEEVSPQMFDQSPAPGRPPLVIRQDTDGRLGKRDNPHKYLLYKPSFSQLFVFLASGFKELPPGGAMCVYLSADGASGSGALKPSPDMAFDYGGISCSSKKEPEHIIKKPASIKDMHCLHPGDLYPFSRKPLFLIVDSDNSSTFQHMPNLFGQPLVILMSPEQVPSNIHEQRHRGNLFTLFLHSPLTAFCYVCGISEIHIELWDKAQAVIRKMFVEISRTVAHSRTLDTSYLQFYGDDFLRLVILRFIFCCNVVYLHRGFKGFTPLCQPPIPRDEFLDNVALHRYVFDLATMLNVRSQLQEESGVGG